MNLFIYYSRCSTCQKAKKWLENNNISYEERIIIIRWNVNKKTVIYNRKRNIYRI